MTEEQWELMFVAAADKGRDGWELTVSEAPNFQPIGREPDSIGQGDQGMRLVHGLGKGGWQLVSVETVQAVDNKSTQSNYWLKRRVG